MDPLNLIFGLFTTTSLFLQLKKDINQYDELERLYKALLRTNQCLFEAKKIHSAFQELLFVRKAEMDLFASEATSQDQLSKLWPNFINNYKTICSKNGLDKYIENSSLSTITMDEYLDKLFPAKSDLNGIPKEKIDNVQDHFFRMCERFNTRVVEINDIDIKYQKENGGFLKSWIKNRFVSDIDHLLTSADESLKALINYQDFLFYVYNERKRK